MRGKFSDVNRFGGFLKERVYIMYRVCRARIPVMSDLYFGWRMFFVEEGVDLRRENAVRHMVAPRRRVSAETDSRVMLTRRRSCGPSWPNLCENLTESVADGCMRTSAATKVTMMLMSGQTTGSGAADVDGGADHVDPSLSGIRIRCGI